MGYLGNSSLPFDPLRSNPKFDADRFSGNNSATVFTLTKSVNAPTDIQVFVENVPQEPTVAYTAAGTTLTFTGVPPSGTNNIYVVYRNYDAAGVYVPDGSITYAKLANNIKSFTQDLFTANGAGQTFTLSETPADANTLSVVINGVTQSAPVNYSVTGTTLIFTSAPVASSNISVKHLGFKTVINTLLNSGVVAGVYGNASSIPAITVGLDGRVTGITTAANPQGTVTSVTGTAPVVSSGGATPAISISQANTSTNGYLSSTDWNTFNGKGSGTVTSVSGTGTVNGLTLSGTVTSSGNLTLSGSVTGVSGTASAWVRFLGGTGSPLTITKAYNVSSVTRTALGKYVVNFTSNLADANYCVVASSSSTQSQGIFALPFYTAPGTYSAPSTSSFAILYEGTNGAAFDIEYANIAVFD